MSIAASRERSRSPTPPMEAYSPKQHVALRLQHQLCHLLEKLVEQTDLFPDEVNNMCVQCIYDYLADIINNPVSDEELSEDQHSDW